MILHAILTALMGVHLVAPPVDRPVEYTARDPHGTELVFHADRGTWVGRAECPWGCYAPADKAIMLLQGEVDVPTLAAWNVTIYCEGRPVAWFYRMFDAPSLPVMDLHPVGCRKS